MDTIRYWRGDVDSGPCATDLTASARVSDAHAQDGKTKLLVDFKKSGARGVHVRLSATTCRFLGRWLLDVATWAEEKSNTGEGTGQ